MIESMFGVGTLSALVWLPILGGLLLLAMGSKDGASSGLRPDRLVARFAFGAATWP